MSSDLAYKARTPPPKGGVEAPSFFSAFSEALVKRARDLENRVDVETAGHASKPRAARCRDTRPYLSSTQDAYYLRLVIRSFVEDRACFLFTRLAWDMGWIRSGGIVCWLFCSVLFLVYPRIDPSLSLALRRM